MKIRIKEYEFPINSKTRVDLMATGEELQELVKFINDFVDQNKTDWNYIIQLGYKRDAHKEKP